MPKVLTRADLIDMVARHMALSGDPGGRHEIAQLPDGVLRTIAEAVRATVAPEMLGALTEEPEAEMPLSPPPAADIMAVARGSAGGVGGRFGSMASMQGAVPPTPSPFSSEGGAEIGPVGEGTRPMVTPPPRRLQIGPIGTTFQREPMPPPPLADGGAPAAPLGDAQGEFEALLNSITGPIEASFQHISQAQNRDLVPGLEGLIGWGFAQANLIPQSEPGAKREMTEYLKGVSDRTERLKNSLPPRPTAGADNAVGFANLAQRRTEFAYQQERDIAQDARAEAKELAGFRGWMTDPETGEVIMSPSLRSQIAEGEQREFANKISMAGITGTFDGEEIYSAKKDREATERAERDRRSKLAADFTNHLSSSLDRLYSARTDAEQRSIAAAKYRIPRSMEYVPTREPDSPWRAVYAQAGVPYTPERTADLPDWKDPMAGYEEYYRQVMDAISRHPGHPSVLAGLYGE